MVSETKHKNIIEVCNLRKEFKESKRKADWDALVLMYTDGWSVKDMEDPISQEGQLTNSDNNQNIYIYLSEIILEDY